MTKPSTQLALFPEIETALTLPPKKVDIYERVREATDEETATRFSELVAGLAVYIPAVVDEAHWLSEALGHAQAQAVCDTIADGFGVTMDFPLGKHSEWERTRAAIVEMLNAGGMSANEIAASVGCSRATVQRVKKRLIDHSKSLTE